MVDVAKAYFADFPDLVDGNINHIFREVYDTTPRTFEQFFTVDSWDKEKFATSSISGIGVFPEWDEGEKLDYYAPEQLYDRTTHMSRWGAGIDITEKLKKWDESGKIGMMAQALAEAFRETVELNAARVFNYATASTYHTCGDGQVLAYASHPYSPTDSGVQSNIASAATLSQTTLHTAFLHYVGLKNAKRLKQNVGKQFEVMYPPALLSAAVQAIDNPNEQDTANRNISWLNSKKVRFTHAMNEYLTSTTNWAVMLPKPKRDLRFRWGQKLSSKAWMDEDTNNYKWKAWAWWLIHFNEWRWYYHVGT